MSTAVFFYLSLPFLTPAQVTLNILLCKQSGGV